MSVISMKQLLEAGVHFGHQTRRWNPKMAPYIYTERNGIYIIDLQKSVGMVDDAYNAIKDIVADGGTILFVGTKKQAKDITKAAAESASQPYVTERWIGGMLTNVATITSQLKKLRDLEKRMASGDFEKRYNKLEIQRFQEEIDELNRKYSGIKDLSGKPGALFVTDIVADANAVREAKTLGVPVVAVVDTNADPTDIDYVIPANDDAIKGLQLLLDYAVAAINEGVVKKEEK